MNAHRLRLFHAFLEMRGPLADALGPGRSIVVRPHPSESHEAWLAAAGGRANVHVLHEGTIIPWLLAAEAVGQSGCQTALEAFLLDRPAITYRPFVHEMYELVLPNLVSVHAETFTELVDLLTDAERLKPSRDEARSHAMQRYVAAMDGPLASERIVDALAGQWPDTAPAPFDRLSEKVRTRARALRRRLGISRSEEHT